MRASLTPILLSLAALPCTAQVLIDSIPYPGIEEGFWGISVNADTVFLGADYNGTVYFSDHAGTIIGQQATGLDFNHGLICRLGSFLVAQDYTTDGAHLYEVSRSGALLNTWTFPDVIGGHSSGIGGICPDGNAVWYTMYYPDFGTYPFAYAYKWVPGDATPIDTVPMLGAQPCGIALKGDTLLYVMDNNDGDAERIYAYDLTSEQDLGHVDLPDVDGDQSPRGLCYADGRLYLVANRQGGNAFAYQTVFIYAFDTPTFIREERSASGLTVHPNPASGQLYVDNGTGNRLVASLSDAAGRILRAVPLAPGPNTVDVSGLHSGLYLLRSATGATRVLVR